LEANDYLMGGGTTSAKFAEVGDTVSGSIARKPELQQQRSFEDGTPLTWDDGSPRQQIKVILQTKDRDDEDDNGERAIYLKGALLKAVQSAVKKAGAKGLEVGGKLAVKFTGTAAPVKKGLSGAKEYVAKYEAPDPAADAFNEPEPVEAPKAAKAKAAPAAEDDADLKF